MKTFLFVNQSCYRRQEEIATVRRFFFLNDYAEDTTMSTADVVILFTCAFCQSRVADMMRELDAIRAQVKFGCEVIVGSCLPQTDPAALRRTFTGKVITPTDFSALDALPGLAMPFGEVAAQFGADAGCLMVTKRGAAAPVSPAAADQQMGLFIAAGCRRKCTYCAIRFATGALRSKPLDVVTRSVTEGIERGCGKFELHADSIGDYGLDIGTSLGALFDWFLQCDRQFSVGLYDLHPDAFLRYSDQIGALCDAGKVHYLYVPVQSGNARVLRAMNRPCDLSALKTKLHGIRRPASLFLQTSIIVGFPGETDAEFDDTVEFLRDAGFTEVYIHFYSDMPNTASAALPDKIDKATMRRRLGRLDAAGIPHRNGSTLHEFDSMPEPETAPAVPVSEVTFRRH